MGISGYIHFTEFFRFDKCTLFVAGGFEDGRADWVAGCVIIRITYKTGKPGNPYIAIRRFFEVLIAPWGIIRLEFLELLNKFGGVGNGVNK